MTSDRETQLRPGAPLVEEPEPAVAYSPVEPDDVASVRLIVRVGALVVVLVLVMLGIWRLLASQSSAELRRKEASDSRNEAVQLEAEAATWLGTGGLDPKTGKRRLSIGEAIRAVVKDPKLLGPLGSAPAPMGGAVPGSPGPGTPGQGEPGATSAGAGAAAPSEAPKDGAAGTAGASPDAMTPDAGAAVPEPPRPPEPPREAEPPRAAEPPRPPDPPRPPAETPRGEPGLAPDAPEP